MPRRGWRWSIYGDVHGVMELHGADFVLGPQISMLDCMQRGVGLTGVAVLTQKCDSGIVSLKESGITSPRHAGGQAADPLGAPRGSTG